MYIDIRYPRRSYRPKIRPFLAPNGAAQIAAIFALDQHSEDYMASPKTARPLYLIIRYFRLLCNKKKPWNPKIPWLIID